MTPSNLGVAVVTGFAQMIPNLYLASDTEVVLMEESHMKGETLGKLLPVIPLLGVPTVYVSQPAMRILA